MSVGQAILGFLSWRPMTGYDLKRMFVDTPFIPWSGNNNQVYKALLELHKQGMVTIEVRQQEKYPAKKVYGITEKGQSELRKWIASEPEGPVCRNTFLIQLAWADRLEPEVLSDLLEEYEQDIRMRLRMRQEEGRRRLVDPARSIRESFLWAMIAENRILAYESELEWVRRLRKGLADLPQPTESGS